MLRATTRLFSTTCRGAQKYSVLMDTAPAEGAVVAKNDVKLMNSVTPNFQANTLYDPFDFSMARIRLERKQAKDNVSMRVFDEKRLNPLDFYLRTKYLSNYVSSTGRILPREVTKLTVKNQKRLAKAIKRARAAGLLSSVHPVVSSLVHKN